MNDDVIILGLYSPNSQMGGRVFSKEGLAPTIMAGTHGYGFGCILEYEDTDIGRIQPSDNRGWHHRNGCPEFQQMGVDQWKQNH